MNDTVIAADLGGTNLRMAVVDREGSLLYRSTRQTRGVADSEVLVEDIVEAARECLAAVTGSVAAMGIAVPVSYTHLTLPTIYSV